MNSVYERRIRAFSIDLSAISVLMIVLPWIGIPEEWQWFILIFGFAIVFIFPLILSKGQTFGKRMQRIRVIKRNGEMAPRWLLLLRELIKITFILFSFGLYTLINSFFISNSGEFGALHDFICRTKVVALKKENQEVPDGYLDISPSLRKRGLDK